MCVRGQILFISTFNIDASMLRLHAAAADNDDDDENGE